MSGAIGYTTAAEVERLRAGKTAVVQGERSDACTVAVRLGEDDAAVSAEKVLEWRESGAGNHSSAHSELGLYVVSQTRSGNFRVFVLWIVPGGNDADREICEAGSLLEAKAAAQADFERRVLSCLSTHTAAGAGPVGEAVAWLFEREGDPTSPKVSSSERLTDAAKRAGWAERPLYARPVEPGEVERITRERDEALEEVEKAAEDGYAEGYQEGLVEGRNDARGAYRDVFKFVYNWLDDRKLIFDEGEGINVNDVEEGLRIYQNDALAIERNRADDADARSLLVRAALAETRERLEKVEAAARPFVALASPRHLNEGGSPSLIDIMTDDGDQDEIELRGMTSTSARTEMLHGSDFRDLLAALTGDAQEAGRSPDVPMWGRWFPHDEAPGGSYACLYRNGTKPVALAWMPAQGRPNMPDAIVMPFKMPKPDAQEAGR